MTNQGGLGGGLGGGSLPSVAGTATGVGSGALLLPNTGSSDLILLAMVIAGSAATAMFISMAVAKLIRKTSVN